MRPKRLFDNMETIERATQRLANACMARKGLHPNELAQFVDRVQGEVVPDMSFRRKEGFGFSHYLRPIWQVDDAHLDEWYRAYRGTEAERVSFKTIAGRGSTAGGGCLAKAQTAIAGSVLNWFWAVDAQQDYWLVTAAAMNQDPRSDAAVARWVPCMDAVGYPGLGGPMGAWKKARLDVFGANEAEGKVTQKVRRAEVAIAVADGKCQLSTGMDDAQRAMRLDFLKRAPSQFLHDLDRIAKAQRRALKTIVTKGLDR